MARPPPIPDRSLEARWYSDAPRYSVPPPSIRPPPPPIGHPTWSTALGGLAGALGGFMMLLSAQFVVFVSHSRADLVSASRALTQRLLHAPEFPFEAFVLPVLGGMLLGALLGFLTRRLLRVLPRLLFFGMLLPTVMLFLHGIVIRRLAPGMVDSLPFVPLLVGALAYATFLAVVAPVRLRQR